MDRSSGCKYAKTFEYYSFLPPLFEQKRIVEIHSLAEDLISKQTFITAQSSNLLGKGTLDVHNNIQNFGLAALKIIGRYEI
jgi:hypothetical protein